MTNVSHAPDTGGNDTTRDMLPAAVTYAQQYGWAVFPCRPSGGKKAKAPLLPSAHREDELQCRGECGQDGHGCLDATLDTDRIARWWQQHPDAAIGVHAGRAGLVVIDLDRGKPLPDEWALPGIVDGEDTLTLLAHNAAEPFPWTRSARTPSGGIHLYYQAPEGVAIGPSSGRIAPMVDVRAGDSYVIAPPSQVDGKPYLPLDPKPIQPLPDWVAQLATTAPEPSRHKTNPAGSQIPGTGGLAALTGFILDAQPGTRNTSLHWASCRAAGDIAAGRYTRNDAEAVLLQAAEHVGLPAGEATKTIHSGLRSVPA